MISAQAEDAGRPARHILVEQLLVIADESLKAESLNRI
jgi:hypothetical protein